MWGVEVPVRCMWGLEVTAQLHPQSTTKAHAGRRRDGLGVGLVYSQAAGSRKRDMQGQPGEVFRADESIGGQA